jgi:hypothetical protein
LIIIKSSGKGNILFSKYFPFYSGEIVSDEMCLKFEKQLYENTSHFWLGLGEAAASTQATQKIFKSVSSVKKTVTINDIYVVFHRFHDFIIFASGTEEIDEPICKMVHFN